MRKFILGFVSGILLLLLAVFLYVRFGFVDPRADIPINAIEMHVAMPALDASVDRRAPEIKNPVALTSENLLSGMQIYQSDCASCHGDVNHPHAALAETLYPRPPQFVEDAPDMPENQNYYIIRHGVRLSGMPGWKDALSNEQMWQVTTFLSHMDKLPPDVADAWKTAATQH
uniref:C-type cytochrome n=1 Tax=Acidobacterium capsulatum TaxID=33075 RepID=A0A7V4XTD6_9BACT